MQFLTGRRILACGACGWVHYAMSPQEWSENERALQRYNLTAAEWLAYESSFRQCLRCEAPVSGFHDAREPDLARAAGHVVTPVLMEEF
jgi:hypothetical protein